MNIRISGSLTTKSCGSWGAIKLSPYPESTEAMGAGVDTRDDG